jgi:uncharacterized membrane protein
MIALCALLTGFVAGLRSMLPLAVVSWCAYLRVVDVTSTHLSFMGSKLAVGIFTLMALAELVVDKLPSTPSRKAPTGFVARLVSGALSGATVAASTHLVWLGLILGALGAVAGTLGGAAARGKLAATFGRDLPAALLEDAAAIAIAFIALLRLA